MAQIAMTADRLRTLGYSPEMVNAAAKREANNPGGAVPVLVVGEASEPLAMPEGSEEIERMVRWILLGEKGAAK